MELKIGQRSAGRFFMDWAAVVALVVSVAVFGALRGGDFLSAANAGQYSARDVDHDDIRYSGDYRNGARRL